MYLQKRALDTGLGIVIARYNPGGEPRYKIVRIGEDYFESNSRIYLNLGEVEAYLDGLEAIFKLLNPVEE